MNPYSDFQNRFKLLVTKHPKLIINTLSNIFTMRLIGNKTHGDLAEIGIAEFIDQFMYDWSSKHVGKDLFRSKEHEEDIVLINGLTKDEIPISLKAYGDGPLQLSTDKNFQLFPALKQIGKQIIEGDDLNKVFNSDAFSILDYINVMPLIYREKKMQCNIMVFDFTAMKANTNKVIFIPAGYKYDAKTQQVIVAKSRKHPIFMFLDNSGKYICEVRYGDATANALQRGLWTHTKNASQYFNSLTNGWISYKHNQTLVQMFRLALNATKAGHEKANKVLQTDINDIRANW